MEVAEPRFIHLSNKFSKKSASCGLDTIVGVGDTAKNKMEQRHPCPHASDILIWGDRQHTK